MRKRAERTLKELYDLTERISEPNITPVLKGSYHIQGPVDDLDNCLQGTGSDENKILFPNQCTAVSEAGKCTVCSAPCSLCMHYKSGSAFSYNLSIRTEADSSSVINVYEMSVLKSSRCIELQHTASEMSNLLSTSSSHVSYSENAKVKTNLRPFDAADASDDVDMPQVLFSDKIVEEEQPLKRNHDSHEFDLHNDTPQLIHRLPPEKGDEQSELECHGDNILCISGVVGSDVVVGDSIVNIEEKDMEHRNISINTVVGNKNIISAEAGNDNHGHETVESHCISKWSNAPMDSSLLHNCCNLASVNNVSYIESQPLHNNETSPKASLSSHHEYATNPAFLKGESMVIEECLNMQPHEEISICAQVDKLDSSLASLTSEDSLENEASNFTKHAISTEIAIKHDFPAANSHTDGLLQDTRLGILYEKPSVNSSNKHHINDLERDDTLLVASKDEDENVQKDVIMEEIYELDVILDDVKVCDTCGDAGREDLLAICSRCNDGAEHTYCMQVMLDKVPEGEWLCGECKIKAKDNQSVDECEGGSERLKSSRLTDINQNSMGTLIPNQACKEDSKPADLVARGSVKGLQGLHISVKRQVDHLEEGKASELSGASMETASPRKKPVLSRQISSINQDMGKVKAAIMETSFEVLPAKGSDVFSRPKTYLSSSSFKGLAPLCSPHGHFSRSFSFNNSNVNRNVKTLIENAPSKQRTPRKPMINDLRKDSLYKSSTKTTFKNTTSGFSNTESTNKKPSLQHSHTEDIRSLTGVKERNTVEKKNFSAIGNSSVGPSAAIASNHHPKTDAKSVQLQNDGKLNIASETSVRHPIEGLDADDLGSNQGKKNTLYSSKCIESSNGNADNPKRSKVNNEGSQSVNVVDGSYRKFDITSSQSAVQPLQSGYKCSKIRDSSTAAVSRLSALGGYRSFHSPRGSEAGRPAHHSSTDKLGGYAHKSSAEQKLREVDNKGNKWREVVVTAMSKNVLKCDKLHTPEEIPAASVDMISEAASKHTPSALNQSSFSAERNNGKVSSNDSAEVPNSTFASMGSVRLDVTPAENSYETNSIRDSPAIELSTKSFAETAPSDNPVSANQLNGSAAQKPPHLACPLSTSGVSKPFLFANPLSGTAVPKLECVWQGSFNVIGTGSPPNSFFGIQAHLSNCASHRVFQLATKAPYSIRLEEVSHISSCPLQLLRAGSQEENIALFFFAKDIESYNKSYRKLMDNMHRNDLALRGNIDGDELLIFTSNKLPTNSQRWNKMHYLWGMFRGQRRCCLSMMDDKESLPNQNFPLPVSAHVCNGQNLETSLKLKKLSDSTASGKPGESINGVDFPNTSPQVVDKITGMPVAFPVQNLLNQVPADPKVPQQQPSFLVGSLSGAKHELLSAVIDTPNLRFQISTTKSCSEEKKVEKKNGTCQGKVVSDGRKAIDSLTPNHEIGVKPDISSIRKAASAPSVSSKCTEGAGCINVKEENEETFLPIMTIVDDDHRGSVLGAGPFSCESTTNRKRGRSASLETLLQHSSEMSNSAVRTMLPGEKPTSRLPVDDEMEPKKTCYPRPITTTINNNGSARLSSKVHPLHSSISRHRQFGENISGETSNTRSTERCFFPVGLGPAQITKTGNVIDIPSSDEDDALESSSPDLELALGGKSTSTKPFVLPSLFHSVDGGRQRSQPDRSGDADDASASLSLSLFSFPAPDKEKSAT